MPISQQEKQFSSIKKVAHPNVASYPVAWVQDGQGMDGRRGSRGRGKAWRRTGENEAVEKQGAFNCHVDFLQLRVFKPSYENVLHLLTIKKDSLK